MTAHIPDPAVLLETAVAAAQAAGRHALAHHGRRRDTLSVSRHDVKLRLDVECQEKAFAAIRARHPEHGFLGEESDGSDRSVRSDRSHTPEWVVDPIDGTVNFFHGLPLWNTSVAVRLGEEVLAGAVYVPVSDELYTATLDGPALLNGAPLAVSDTAELGEALVCTGMDKNATGAIPPYAIMEHLAGRVQRIRVLGSAALDLCAVARGAADGYSETGIYIWDIAAAGLIVRRAGGKAAILERLEGGRLTVLAANAHLFDALRDIVLSVPRG
jgi:myo-inositol-1(or 4)-monophosphatase